MDGSRYTRSQDGDLTGQSISLDRRMLDWIVGLDTEINEVVEGANLYTPTVRLAHVVLPKEQKEKIMSAVTSYTAFKAFKKRKALEKQKIKEAEAQKLAASPSTPTPDNGGGAAAAAAAHEQQPGGDLSDVVAGLVFLFSGQ